MYEPMDEAAECYSAEVRAGPANVNRRISGVSA